MIVSTLQFKIAIDYANIIYTYEAEIWAIWQTDESKLLIFEREILRITFRLVKDIIKND